MSTGTEAENNGGGQQEQDQRDPAATLREKTLALQEELAKEDGSLEKEALIENQHIKAAFQAATDATNAEFTIIEAEGQKAVLSGDLSDAEIRNAHTSLEGSAFDKLRIGIEAGINTRDGALGSNLKSREARIAQTKVRAEADARIQQLLALQAQLDALNAQIAALDDDINDILQKHLSPKEMDYLDALSPEERRAEEMRIMREKLEAGEITQGEFDGFKDRWDARAQKMDQRTETKHALDAAKSETEIVQTVDNFGTANAEAVADTMEGSKKVAIDAAVENRVDTGSARQNQIQADLGGGWGLSGDGGAVMDTLKGKAKESFDIAASDTGRENAPALAQEQDLKQISDINPPLPGMG